MTIGELIHILRGLPRETELFVYDEDGIQSDIAYVTIAEEGVTLEAEEFECDDPEEEEDPEGCLMHDSNEACRAHPDVCKV